MSETGYITTGVDTLIKLLKQYQRLSIEDAARQLGISLEVVQNWVDFLVEEEVIGIEYKFVTPYIYLIQKSSSSGFDTKEEFYAKAQQRGISGDKARALWVQYVTEHHDSIKEAFYNKALERRIPADKIDQLWEQYDSKLLEE